MMWTGSPDSESGKTLAEAGQKTDWQVPAYCLMPNHFHKVVETPNAHVVAGRRWGVKLRSHHCGALHRETAKQKANRMMAEELTRLGWKDTKCATRLKSDPKQTGHRPTTARGNDAAGWVDWGASADGHGQEPPIPVVSVEAGPGPGQRPEDIM